MQTILVYGLVALGIYSAGFGSAWYWQDLRWTASQAEALEDQINAAAAAHQAVFDAQQKLIENKQKEIDGIKRSLDTNLRMLAEEKAKREAINAEYELLKAQSQEVRNWAGTPIPGPVCRVLDGQECAGSGGGGAPGTVRPASYAPPGTPPAGV